MYGVEASDTTITAVTDQLTPELEAWQARCFGKL